MKKSIRVLIVEDSEVDAELMLHTLEDHGFTPETQRVETEASYLQCLEHTPDIILADYRLPRFSGPRALELLKAQALDIPFIVVSGNISDVEAAELIKSGACDFLIKDRMARLGSAVEQALDAKCARDEKRRVEQELAESENKFRLICETVADVVVLVDGDGRMQYANPAIGHVFGYTPGETEGKSIEMLQPVRLREKYRKGVNRFLESHEELHNWGGVERIGRHSDGHEFPIEIRYSKLSLHGKQGFVGVIHDITNRKQAEEALYTSKEIIERIINTIPMRVFWKDKNHVFLGCNDEFAHDAGFSESGEVIGKDDYQMGWRDQAEIYRNDDKEVIASGLPKLYIEEPQTAPDGSSITLLTSKLPLRSSNGDVIGVLGTYIDITERKKTETEVRENLREKEMLLKEIHHRVKNNMQVISSLLSLQSSAIVNEFDRSLFMKSQDRVRSMSLVHELLYGSKDIARIDLAEYAGILARTMFASSNADPSRISLNLDLTPVMISIDGAVPTGLIINELFSNALKYAFPSGKSGVITLRIASLESGGYTFSVSDNGVGVPALVDLNDPPTLGLQLVTILCKQLGATITLDTKNGTKFEVVVPK